MLTIIISILWWCLNDKKGLGIAALILSALGIIFDAISFGWLAIIDVFLFIINLILYIKRDKDGLL